MFQPMTNDKSYPAGNSITLTNETGGTGTIKLCYKQLDYYSGIIQIYLQGVFNNINNTNTSGASYTKLASFSSLSQEYKPREVIYLEGLSAFTAIDKSLGYILYINAEGIHAKQRISTDTASSSPNRNVSIYQNIIYLGTDIQH